MIDSRVCEAVRAFRNHATRAVRLLAGSAEYVNIDSGPERSPQSPRLLRYVHRHQSPSPGPPGAPQSPGSGGRGARQRPRPCIAPQSSARQRRSRSVSGCRRLKFADDDEECEDDEEATQRGPPRESLSSDALTRNGLVLY